MKYNFSRTYALISVCIIFRNRTFEILFKQPKANRANIDKHKSWQNSSRRNYKLLNIYKYYD